MKDFVVVVVLEASAWGRNFWNNFKVKLISELLNRRLDMEFTPELAQDVYFLK